MTATNSNAVLAKQLRDAYNTTGRRKIGLPRSIKFMIDGRTVQMYLDSSCVEANMQENRASFEGWALALKRWLPEHLSQVELSWDHLGDLSDPHYQRFLYRVKGFLELFKDWFKIAAANIHELSKLKTEEAGHVFYLNVASKPRTTDPIGQVDSLIGAMKSEHKLECFIVEHQKELCTLLDIDKLDRQLPVGVFKDCVSRDPAHKIFTRGHSAIDIWGVDNKTKTLFLFELKKHRNESLGILSELFFYSYVMADIQTGRFKFRTTNIEIEQTDSIKAYILAPKWHPLIDAVMLAMVNKAFEKSKVPISFGAVRIENKPGIYSVNLGA